MRDRIRVFWPEFRGFGLMFPWFCKSFIVERWGVFDKLVREGGG